MSKKRPLEQSKREIFYGRQINRRRSCYPIELSLAIQRRSERDRMQEKAPSGTNRRSAPVTIKLTVLIGSVAVRCLHLVPMHATESLNTNKHVRGGTTSEEKGDENKKQGEKARHED